MPSSISETLSRIVRLFEENAVPYMLIGGYALAYLGRIRATVDIDLAVSAKPDSPDEDEGRGVEKLVGLLMRNRYSVSFGDPRNPMFLVLDEVSGNEIEVWHRLDGVSIDEYVLKRRLRVKTPSGLKLWIIDAEDFIVNKLARPDRSAVDEEDVASVLMEQKGKLDIDYLYGRAEKAGVLSLLKSLQKRIMT
jgi:hypothetical protein